MAENTNTPKSGSADSMLNAAAGLVSDKGAEKLKNQVKPGAAAPAAQPAQNVADTGSGAPAAPAAQVAAPVVVKSPLGEQVFGGKPLEEVKLTSFADVAAFAKDHAGIELKDVQDMVSFIDQYKKFQQEAAQAAELQRVVSTYESTLNSLPPEIDLLVKAHLNGENYETVLQKLQKKAAFDFTKPVTAHDDVQLINHYTGKDFTKETFDKLEPAVQESYLDIAKRKYEADQNEFSSIEKNTKSAIEQRQKNFQASVESSISKMLTGLPSMDKAAVDRVRRVMMSDLSSLLFTKDRTYTPEAAENIAYMLYGKQIVQAQAQTIGDLVAKIRNESEGKANEKILLRGDQAPVRGGAPAGGQNRLQSIVERETSFLHAR